MVQEPFMQDVVQIYNQYTRERIDQWERELADLFGTRISRVGVGGILDRGVLDSFKQLPLIPHISGSFYLILSAESEGEGCVVPLPWLQYNNTVLTEPLNPFYNLPEPDNQGIIERLEKPSHLTKFLARTRYELKPTSLGAYRGKDAVELNFRLMKDKLTEMGVQPEGIAKVLDVPKAYEGPTEEVASTYEFEVARKTKSDIWAVIEKGKIKFK